jgi:predicted transcriptional regulator
MEKYRSKIISELQKNKSGYTISELSKKLKLSRQTIANCFAFLEGAEKVNIRQAGMAKIYYWSVK